MLRHALLVSCCCGLARGFGHTLLREVGLLSHQDTFVALGVSDTEAFSELSDADLTGAGLGARALATYRRRLANFTPLTGPPMVWPEHYVARVQSSLRRAKPGTWRQLLTSTTPDGLNASAAERSRLRELAGEAGLGTCLAVARATTRYSIKHRLHALGA